MSHERQSPETGGNGPTRVVSIDIDDPSSMAKILHHRHIGTMNQLAALRELVKLDGMGPKELAQVLVDVMENQNVIMLALCSVFRDRAGMSRRVTLARPLARSPR